ncbi:MAG TPA: hypothetical protein VJS64_15850 [Pyrinomonadaceae bacterium]|nr:hypothetical protein [Pyrinomonadaceae bacterium]
MTSQTKPKVGVMGSAGEIDPARRGEFVNKVQRLVEALAARDVVLFTGATTGLIYEVGKAARAAGVVHVGISPASSYEEHANRYQLPHDGCDVLVYTGFGLKGRNVVLVRSCDIVLFFAGAMGSLNEFTIAHDEGKIIGCLTGTGGVADEADYLLKRFGKETSAKIFQDATAETLLASCLSAIKFKA